MIESAAAATAAITLLDKSDLQSAAAPLAALPDDVSRFVLQLAGPIERLAVINREVLALAPKWLVFTARTWASGSETAETHRG